MTTLEASKATGATPRQLQWWHETNLIVPTMDGSIHGHPDRDYSDADVRKIRILLELRYKGMSLHQIRPILETLSKADWSFAILDPCKPNHLLFANTHLDVISWAIRIHAPIIILKL